MIEVAFDENRAETAETHNFRACLDGAGRRSPNTSKVLPRGSIAEAIRRYEGVNVYTTHLRTARRSDLNMANGAGRNPWQDVSDLLIGQRDMAGSAQDCEYVRSRSPAFLMTDEGEIKFGYTGN
jgi:hypothetical protein